MDPVNVSELGRWFEKEADRLVLYARQWLDQGMAEDSVQDVFASLLLLSSKPYNMKAWLYRSVRNRALKHLRSRGRRRQREENAAAEVPWWFEPRPADAIDAREAETALRGLPAAEREVVTLRIWGGLTLEEIAAVVPFSTATVFRKYRAGLENLRDKLEVSCLTKTN